MSEPSKQNSVTRRTSDNMDDEGADDVPVTDMPQGYPQLAPLNALAKEYDFALLKDCTVARMRGIAKTYSGVNPRLTKPELFQALFDAMLDDQVCEVCQGGCDPLTHLFPPTREPPAGWIRGPNGIHAPAPAVTDPGAPPTQLTPPPPPRQTSEQPAQDPALTAPSLAPVAPVDLVSTNFRHVNPASDLIRRPTGTPDVPVHTRGNPIIPGVSQQDPPPRNVAQLVTAGAAAAGWPPGELASTVVLRHVEDNFEKEIDDLLEQEAAQARARRAEEIRVAEEQRQQAQLSTQELRKAYEIRKRATLKAAMEAEERAHQIRLDQIRAEAASAAPPQNARNQFLTPPAPQLTPPTHSRFLPPAPVSGGLDPSRPRSVSFSNTTHFASQQATPQQLAPQPDPTQQLLGNISPASLDSLIDQRLRALGHGASHSACSTPQLSADKGKMLTHRVTNTHMASRFGIFAQPVFEVPGDVTEVDMSKMQKVMTSGHDKVGPSLCYRQMRWPHRLLQTNVPGFDVVEHKDLTFHQFINGCIGNFMSEVPLDRLDMELANKFSFLQFLVNMSFFYKHSDVLETYRLVHQSWQMKEFEFTDEWDSIKHRLEGIKVHLQMIPQKHTFEQNPANPGPQKQGGGAGGGAAKSSGGGKGGHVKGVPKAYMKKHNICIRFNEKECPQKQTHKNKYDEKVTLQHICGGCFKADNSKHAHPADGCEKGPFDTLFRQW